MRSTAFPRVAPTFKLRQKVHQKLRRELRRRTSENKLRRERCRCTRIARTGEFGMALGREYRPKGVFQVLKLSQLPQADGHPVWGDRQSSRPSSLMTDKSTLVFPGSGRWVLQTRELSAKVWTRPSI